MLSQDITGRYLSSYNWLAFYHTRLYYEYGVTFRCDLTADSRLHIARVGRRGFFIKLCGL